MLIDTESFEYQMCYQLSYMQDRAENQKNFISKILDIKNLIQHGEAIDDADQMLVSSMFDDIIKINQLCINCDDFGDFIHTHSGMDAYLDPKKTKNPITKKL